MEKLRPTVLNTDKLRELYDRTDLEFSYVHAKCLLLIALKGVSISDDQILFWFREMLREGWTKKVFDERFEAIKRAPRFGTTLDFAQWLSAEKMYREDEFLPKVKREIDNRIREGQKLIEYLEKGGKMEFDEDTFQKIKLAAMEEVKGEYINERQRFFDDLKQKAKIENREKIKQKRLELKSLTDEQKIKAFQMLLTHEILRGSINNWVHKDLLTNFYLMQPEIADLEAKVGKSILQLIKE